MKNLFEFFRNNSRFFLFLLFQLIAFLLLFSKNPYHNSYFSNVTQALTGNLYNSRASISDYFSLQRENNTLHKENEMLRDLLKSSHIKYNANVITYRDSLYRAKFQHIGADVVNITTQHPKNYITIDRGVNDGVKEGMGVISSFGMVGHIVKVSANFSIVKPVLHKDFALVVKLKNNNERGTLKWNWAKQKAIVNRIPKHVNVKEGDVVTTSSSESIFPPETAVGKVEKVILKSGEAFYSLELKLATDFSALKSVYVVKNVFKKEQNALELSIQQADEQ